MGNQQSGAGGEGGGKKNDKGEKKKYEPPVPTRVGKKRKRVKGKCMILQIGLIIVVELKILQGMHYANQSIYSNFRTRHCIQIASRNATY